MLLSLITAKRYSTLHLPEQTEGRFLLADPETDEHFFRISADEGKWILDTAGDSRIVDTPPASLWNGMMIRVRIGKAMESACLYAENESATYAKFARCPVSDQVSFSFGSGDDNRFVTSNPYIDQHHFRLICNNRIWKVMDCGTKYGTYVNGVRIGSSPVTLAPGDIVTALNQKFIPLPGLLTFNAQGIDTQKLKGVLKRINLPKLQESDYFSKDRAREWFRRSPRFTDALDNETVSVQAPPMQKTQKEDKQAALLSYGPAASSGLIMLLGGMNPIYGLGMAATSVLWPHLGRKHQEKVMKEEEEKRQKEYEAYLQKIDQELDDLCVRQTNALRNRSIAPKREAEMLLSDRKHLWNRRPEQEDFLDIRMGLGDVPMHANITFPQQNEAEKSMDPMIDKLHEIENKPRDLKQVPIVLPLSKFYTVGFSGPDPLRCQLMERAVLQAAMHVGYDDLKICILGKLPKEAECLKLLEHTWDDQFAVHLVAENMDEVNQLTPALDALLAGHQVTGSIPPDSRGQHIIILITDIRLAQSGTIERMFFNRSLHNVHIITMAEHGRELPSRTELAVSIKSDKGRMIWQENGEKCSEDFTPDQSVTSVLEPMVSLMANTFLEMKTDSEKMPDIVPFLDMFSVKDVNSLNLLSRWSRSDPTRSLRAPIGFSEDGNLCQLDLHEKADGPHGLIAGTTGSGKSELIMSYILSAAVCFSPEELSFVLIDYKGGGMAQAFEHLPHVVGIITNLDGNEINRSLMSIQSELQRRQQLFSDTERNLGIKKIDIYRYQQLYREHRVPEPLPHLVIITDEFAELKTQQPDFLQQLISAARIGRSLGVHLILATQKPAGVVDDQIWSNTNFRLCLRVQDPHDSQDVLKLPDAATLTHVGRFFKQVGYGKSLVKAQSAWTGADYLPDALELPSCYVDVLDHCGGTISRGELSTRRQANTQVQLDVVTEYIASTARNLKLTARKLWLPVLEEKILLSELYRKYNVTQEKWILNPVIGELDDPASQRRDIVRLNLSEGKNAIVYGSLGSGKLQFLTCVLEDLMQQHTPEELNIYILDYADDGLNVLRSAPHIGDVLFSDDDEKLDRFVKMMKEMIVARKRALGGAMASESLEARLEATKTSNVLVVLHHILSLQERAEDQLNELKRIISEGPRYGIYFLATAESLTGLRFAITQLFAKKYVLQMDQDDDYTGILGRTGGFTPGAVHGRGLLRADDKLYEFQTATVDTDIRELCDELQKNWTGRKAETIRIMPQQVTTDDLLPYADASAPLNLPVGFGTEDISPILYNWNDRVVHTVLGMDQEVAEFMNGLLRLASSFGTEAVVFDPGGDFLGLDGVESLDQNDTAQKIQDMFEECKAMLKDVQEGKTQDDRKQKFIIIPNAKKLLDSLDDDTRESLEAMLKKARPEWKWIFVVCDMAPNFNKLMLTEWFNASVSKTDTICLGGGMGQQSFVQVSGNTYSLYKPIAYPLGYIVRKGRIDQVKYLSGQPV